MGSKGGDGPRDSFHGIDSCVQTQASEGSTSSPPSSQLDMELLSDLALALSLSFKVKDVYANRVLSRRSTTPAT